MSQVSGSETEKAGEPVLGFGPFRVEAATRLWHGDQLVEDPAAPLDDAALLSGTAQPASDQGRVTHSPYAVKGTDCS